jgi:hypothetical protein
MRTVRYVIVLVVVGLVSSMCPVSAGAQSQTSDPYATVWVAGTAAVTIDGDLSDWAVLGVPQARLDYVTNNAVSSGSRDTTDLSATVRCFADANNLYVGVAVRDGTLVFGRRGFNRSWRDDAVLVSFYGGVSLRHLVNHSYEGLDGQLLVSVDEEGRTLIEGGGTHS